MAMNIWEVSKYLNSQRMLIYVYNIYYKESKSFKDSETRKKYLRKLSYYHINLEILFPINDFLQNLNELKKEYKITGSQDKYKIQVEEPVTNPRYHVYRTIPVVILYKKNMQIVEKLLNLCCEALALQMHEFIAKNKDSLSEYKMAAYINNQSTKILSLFRKVNVNEIKDKSFLAHANNLKRECNITLNTLNFKLDDIINRTLSLAEIIANKKIKEENNKDESNNYKISKSSKPKIKKFIKQKFIDNKFLCDFLFEEHSNINNFKYKLANYIASNILKIKTVFFGYKTSYLSIKKNSLFIDDNKLISMCKEQSVEQKDLRKLKNC